MNSIRSILRRYYSLQSHRVYELPVVVLMPHSACNCRCMMCDIWKGNGNLQQLREGDVSKLVKSLKKFRTRVVLMSGGEALLHENFFALCKILQEHSIKVHLHSTGLTLKHHAENILKYVDEVIVSLDGPEEIHNEIRQIPNAFQKLREGVTHLKSLQPAYRITGRSVMQRKNFSHWDKTIESAREIGLDQISFLTADISSHAFNREELWNEQKQDDIRISRSELPELKAKAEEIISKYSKDFQAHFIAESPAKIRQLVQYYFAVQGLTDFPGKQCNAPWVSAVIEADGKVRPCFFHEDIGNIHHQSLDTIINGIKGIDFRKKLDVSTNATCVNCVCSLHLKPTATFD